jgi:hypothetical protein
MSTIKATNAMSAPAIPPIHDATSNRLRFFSVNSGTPLDVVAAVKGCTDVGPLQGTILVARGLPADVIPLELSVRSNGASRSFSLQRYYAYFHNIAVYGISCEFRAHLSTGPPSPDNRGDLRQSERPRPNGHE